MSLKKLHTTLAGGVLAAVLAISAVGAGLAGALSSSEYKNWKQYGSSWSQLHLGSSSETVARSGCAVTSAAILMVQSGSVTDSDFTPGTIVSYLNAHGGFTSSGCIDWNKLSSYAPDFVYCGRSNLSGSQADKASKMQSLLNQGYYLIANVKNGGHFVAVDSVSGQNVTMMDPGSSSTSLFGKYAASGVISLRLFKGTNSNVTEISEPEPTEPVTEARPAETTTEATETTAESTETTAETTTTETTVTEETTTSTEETTTTTTEATTEAATEAATTTQAAATTAPAATTAATTVVTTAATTVYTTAAAPAETEPAVTLQTMVVPTELEMNLYEAGRQRFMMSVKFQTMDNLHLREEPNTQADILTVIPAGTYLDVTETDADFKWGKVTYNDTEGWISLSYAGL